MKKNLGIYHELRKNKYGVENILIDSSTDLIQKIDSKTNLIQNIDIIENNCFILNNYPYTKCSTCEDCIHISTAISYYGICNICDSNLYKQYSYNSKLVRLNRPVFTLSNYCCQKCGIIDQTIPGGESFFCKFGNYYYNFCSKCFNSK